MAAVNDSLGRDGSLPVPAKTTAPTTAPATSAAPASANGPRKVAETLATDHPARARFLRLGVVALFGLTLAAYLLLIDADILFTYWTDQTHYLVYGVAWAQGFGRHFIAVPGAPFDDIFHHSGFGAMLAPVIRSRGLDVPLLKALVVVVFFIGLGCYGNLIERREGRLDGWLAAILTATAPFTLTFSQLVMADLPFVGVALVALWAFDRWTRSPHRSWLIIGLAATFTANELRIVAPALILALAIPLLRPRAGETWPARQRYAALAVLAAILIWWPIYGWFERGADFFRLFGSEIQKVEGADRAEAFAPLLMILARVRNLPAYLAILGQMFIPQAGSGIAAGLVGLAVLPLCAAGLIGNWKKFASAHEYYLAMSLLVLLVWSYPEARYFLPLYPLIFALALAGVRGLADRFRLRPGHHLPALVFGVVLACNLTMIVSRVVNLRPVPAGQTRLKKLPSDSPPWLIDATGGPSIAVTDRFRMMPMTEPRRNLLELEVWCRTHLAKSDLVLVPYESDFFLITGIRCGDLFPPGEPFADYVRRTGVDYVIVSEGLPGFSSNVRGWMTEAPGRFTEVYRIPGTQTAIYRIK